MTILSDISLKTSTHGAVIFLLALAAILVSYAVYRKTIPPVSTLWRIILTTLRAVSIILVLLLLFEPILSLTRQKQEKPVVAVLIDNSASMSLVDEKVDRPEALRKVLSTPLFKKPDSRFQFDYYDFSQKLGDMRHDSPDSLTLNGDGTDIRRALEELNDTMAERYFASVIMLTDGASNLGENPVRYAKSYPVPIYPVGVGDPSEQKDALVSNFVTNEVAYAGKQVPVDIYVKSSGFNGARVPVNLTQEGKIIDSKTVTLSDNGMEQKVRLHFTPTEEGLLKYEIKMPQLEGELTQANNTKSFYTKVLKSKLKVLLLAGAPSPDFSFLKRALANDENIEVQPFVEKQNGRFYQGSSLPGAKELEAFDCYILMDYPRRNSRASDLTELKRLFANGKSAMFFIGKNTDLQALWSLKDFLPIASMPAKRQEQNVTIKVLPQGLNHPVMRIYEDALENRDSWSDLPPVFLNLASVKAGQGSSTLAAVDNSRPTAAPIRAEPLVLVHDSGKRKSVLVTAYGLWRWDLLVQGVGKSNANYRNFLRNSIRWLTTHDDSKLVRVTPNKEIYRSGEQVKFTGQVYSEDYQPVDGAEVSVQLTSTGKTEELTLTGIGDGRYEGNYQVLGGGDYQFTGTAHQYGRVLGRDSGKFSAEEFSLEFQSTHMNEQLLRGVAAESGGEFFTYDDFSGLHEKLTFPAKYVTLKSEWEIWKKTPVLIACLLLLGTEWLIRKRKGML